MLDSKKILIVTTVPETIRAFMIPLIESLVNQGHTVHVATGQGCSLPVLDRIGVKEVRLNLNRSISPLSDAKALWQLWRICKRERYDLIHTHTLKASLVGQLSGFFSGIKKRLVTVHGTVYSPSLPSITRMLVFASEKISTSFAHKVWVLNSEDYDFFKNRIKVRPDRLEILGKGGIGVDLDSYRPDVLSQEQRDILRKQVGISNDRIVVGFIGRLVKDKGVRELIEAWRSISREFPKATLLIITAKLATERSNELVSYDEIKSLNNVVILENREDMANIYNIMDVVALPSYREGFSRVVLEASASGLPLVVSDVKGCRDGVINCETGFVIPPKDSIALKEHLSKLIANEEMRNRFGSNARKYAVENFDEAFVINKTVREYEKA